MVMNTVPPMTPELRLSLGDISGVVALLGESELMELVPELGEPDSDALDALRLSLSDSSRSVAMSEELEFVLF